ncbi:MAG: protein kinase [Candidatus Riflebacteria bacterium]|nr:protein kinase [Candidatus Riflebacteria bacterium]
MLASICPSCGHVIDPATDGSSPIHCPECRSRLSLEGATEVSILTCGDDGGVESIARVALGDEFRQRYGLVRALGRGAGGIVFLATHVAVRRPVAIKFLIQAKTPEHLARFLREGRILGSVHHPNVMQVFDCGAIEGFPYLVVELLEGGSLRDLLKRKGRLFVGEAVQIVADCLTGLHACHERGVIHRDLKPENIMFTAARKPKIVDFGIARDRSDLVSLTSTGTLIGTPNYLSPESIDGRPAQVASDIYAMGVIIYEMLAGRRPFVASRLWSVLDAHLNAQPPSLREFAPNVPPDLARLIDAALSKSPEGRPSSAVRFAEELREISASRFRRADSGGISRPASRPEDRVGARRSGLPALSVARAALVAAGVALLVAASLRGLWGPDGHARGSRNVPLRSTTSASSDPVSPARATVLFDFPRHRRMRVWAVPPRDRLRVTLTLGSRMWATASFDPAAGGAILDDLPPGASGELQVLDSAGRRICRPVAVRLPDCAPVAGFLCQPFVQGPRGVLVDFDLPEPLPVTVEVGPWQERKLPADARPRVRTISRVAAPPGTRVFRHVFTDVVQAWTTGKGTVEDSSLIPVFRQVLSTTDPRKLDRDVLSRMLDVVQAIRDPGLAVALEPHLERALASDLKERALNALVLGRHPRAVDLCGSMLGPKPSGRLLELYGRALARRGLPGDCELIAGAQRANPDCRLTSFLGRCDRSRAKDVVTALLTRAVAGEEQLLPRAFVRLEDLGGEEAVSTLTGLLAPDRSATVRSGAAEVIARLVPPSQYDPGASEARAKARSAVLEAFSRAPTTPSLLWAVARLGLDGGGPTLSTILDSPGDPRLRRDAACALGLLRAPAAAVVLRRALADPSPWVASAAAWGLAKLGDREAERPLLDLALSGSDRFGVAAWALGMLGAQRAAEPLHRQLVRLSSLSKDETPSRMAALCWTMGKLSWAPAMEDLRRLASDPARSRFIRVLAKKGLAPVRGQADGQFSFFKVPDDRSRAPQVHVAPPVPLFDRSGLYLYPGDCISFYGESWLEREERPGPAEPAPASVQRSPQPRLRLVVGDATYEVGSSQRSVSIDRAGELLITAHDLAARAVDRQTHGDVTGFGWVILER